MNKPTRSDLENQFIALTLRRYNQYREEPVSQYNITFLSYLNAMVWNMVKSEEIEDWIDYLTRKLNEEDVQG